MPTYDYECNACHHAFEALQSMSEPKLTQCPACGKEALTRLIGTGGGVIFKGSGFYETDYKRKSESPSSSPAKDSAKKDSPCSSGNCPLKGASACDKAA